jgi:hypothetical protein
MTCASGALELLGVKPISLGAPVLARPRHEATCSQPEGQLEAIPAGLEGDGDAVHRMKNLFSRVAAVVLTTRKQTATADEYPNALEGRIASLVDAHD